MKKSLIVLALAAALVLAFAAPAMAVGPFFPVAAQNASAPGYLSWSWAVANAGETDGSPHGNYTTTTNKCAVCHSVHRATANGVALTAIPEAGYATYTDACAFCHAVGSTFTDKVVMADVNGTIAPHGNCWRCHIESPHGADTSVYPALKSRLLLDTADVAIANDAAELLALGIDMATVDNASTLTLGTGYLCNACHNVAVGTEEGMSFAVAADDFTPSAVDHDGNLLEGGTHNIATGHRVLATVTTTWNQAGEYGAFYTGGGEAGAQSQIAYNPVSTCKGCHDQKLADNVRFAFPHGYLNASGAYVGKVAGAGFIWMTMAADADDAKVVLARGASSTDGVRLTQDGLCLKCHVSAPVGPGIGRSF